MRRHVTYLSGKVGERNEGRSWELADAADYIAAELEGMGLAVERQGYETRNVAAQNLAVTISGSERGDQIFLVGAQYDTPAGDRGENAGGSATAALLTLVSMMKGASLKRTLRFVFFSMGESPHGDGEGRGARHYARFVAGKSGNEMAPRGEDEMQVKKRAETVGVLLLDRLAVFEEDSSRRASLATRVTVSQGSEVVRELVLADFDREVFALTESKLEEPGADSDLRAFQEQGVPGLALAGTGADAEAVRYDELARVVMQIRRGIGRVSGERPTNDGMLTPLSR
jgi:Zn-dependent M28 family amino/carboxypeptidase